MTSVLLWAACSLLVTSAALAQLPPDLAVQKTGPAEAAAGSNVSYTVTVTNIGEGDAGAVTLQDPIPTGMTFVSAIQNSGPTFVCPVPANAGDPVVCTGAALPAGASAVFTFVFNINSGTGDGVALTNVATAMTSGDANEENDSGSAVTYTPSAGMADVYVYKNGPNAAGPDTDVTYTLTVGNSGPDAAQNLQWTDILPGTMTFVSLTQNSGPAISCTTPTAGSGGTITCTAASLAAGTSATYTLVTHIPTGTPSGTEFNNTATVKNDLADTNENNNASSQTVTVTAVDVTIDKSAPATATAGDQLTYTLTVTNKGPDGAPYVSVEDVLPPGTTFVSAARLSGPAVVCSGPPVGTNGTVSCTTSLAAQDVAVIEIVVTIGNTTSITNTATATTTSYDEDPSNNSDSAATTVTPLADLSVTKTGPLTADAGTNLTYTVTLANNGPSDAASVTLTDPIPANTTFVSLTQNSGPTFSCTTAGTISCTLGTMAPGAVATFTIVVHSSSSAAAGTVITNTATATSTTADANSADNSDSRDTTLTASADVSVTKTGAAAVSAGGDVTYTVTTTNAGPSDALSVSLTDTVPAGTTFVSWTQNSGPVFVCNALAPGGTGTITCTLATFAAQATATFTLVVHVPPSAVLGSTISNTAAVTATTADPNSANNSSTTTATVAVSTDLELTKTASEPGVKPGNTIEYTLNAINNGPADASAVQITDSLPANTTFVSLLQTSGPTFNCVTPAVGDTGVITCTAPSLATLQSATFTLTVRVGLNATDTITNTATISSANSDPTSANNTGAAAVRVASANIPTLSTWGLMALAAALALIVLFKR